MVLADLILHVTQKALSPTDSHILAGFDIGFQLLQLLFFPYTNKYAYLYLSVKGKRNIPLLVSIICNTE